MAWICCFVPTAKGGGGSFTVIELKDTDVTVIFLVPVIEPSWAVIWDVPVPTLKMSPPLLTVSTLGFVEAHETEFVMV